MPRQYVTYMSHAPPDPVLTMFSQVLASILLEVYENDREALRELGHRALEDTIRASDLQPQQIEVLRSYGKQVFGDPPS